MMFSSFCGRVLSLVSIVALPSILAHRPALTKPSCGNDYASSEDALFLWDPTISWAFNHYVDCESRATWIEFENPSADFMFYVGVLVPVVERFSEVRADAVIIGPGLPSLTEEEWALVPEEVKASLLWQDASVGAILHRSPQDQSTCDHLGTVMTESSSVKNGRCDFFEPFGQSNSWPILDADNNAIPVEGGTYHVAVWLQDDTSSKITIALGTWVEDFRTQFDIATPTCSRNLGDFHEKSSDFSASLPFTSCNGVTEIQNDDIGSDSDICELGQVCETEADCVIAGYAYEKPSMVCGGMKCPAATALWEEVNMRMMMNMMDIEYTGSPDIDFVRGMIPHHEAARDMCDILLNDLTCTEVSDIDNLDGLVHLCSHIELEQFIEVGVMRRWLETKGIEEKATCATSVSRQSDPSSPMIDSCGLVSTPSSSGLIEVNHKMHDAMAIDVSCDHAVDFVRGMLPHHEGAIGMCEVLMNTTTDSFLIELCGNITQNQYAEIAWMREWLDIRGHAAYAPCAECEMMMSGDETMETMGSETMGANMTSMGMDMVMSGSLPCEDLLSTSSFCHLLGQDAYCKCSDVLGEIAECGTSTFIEGVGVMNVDEQCARSCGLCPGREPIFHYLCNDEHDAHGGHEGHGTMDGGMSNMGMDNMEENAASGAGLKSKALGFSLSLFSHALLLA